MHLIQAGFLYTLSSSFPNKTFTSSSNLFYTVMKQNFYKIQDEKKKNSNWNLLFLDIRVPE